MPRMEDGFFVNDLVEQSRVYPLSRPDLYIYEIHAANTWNQKHFQLSLSMSQPLSPAVSKIIGDIMDGRYGVTEASQKLSSEQILSELTYFYVNNFTASTKQLEAYRQQMTSSFEAARNKEKPANEKCTVVSESSLAATSP